MSPAALVYLDSVVQKSVDGHVENIYSTDIRRSHILTAVAIAGQNIIAIVVILRLYTRLLITHLFGMDDWLMVAAVIVNLGVTALNILCAHAGAGKHIGTLSTTLELFSKTSWIGSILNIVAQTFLKASLLVFYIKLFPGSFVRFGSHVLLLANVLYGIAGTLTLIFQCIPVGTDDFMPGTKPHCIDLNVFFYANGWILLIVDISIFLLPLPSLMQSKMTRGQRLSIALIFAVGIIPCVATIFRIIYVSAARSTNDITYILGGALIWGVIELDLAIICACAASLKPLVRIVFPTWLGGSSGGFSERDNISLTRPRKQSFALRTFGTPDERAVGGKFGLTSMALVSDAETGRPTFDAGVFNVEIAKTTEVVVADDLGVTKIHISDDDSAFTKLL